MPVLSEKKILPSLILEYCYKYKLFYNIFHKVLMWSTFYWFLSKFTINFTFSFANNHLTHQLILFLLGRGGIVQRFQTTAFNGHCRISFVLFASLKIKLSY